MLKWTWVRPLFLLAAILIAGGAAAPSASSLTLDLDATVVGLDTPAILPLAAGTYQLDVIGIAGGGAFDAFNPWGSSNCGNPAGCSRTAPTTNTGFLTGLRILSASISSVTVADSLLDPVANFLPIGSSFNNGVGVQIDNGLVFPNGLSAQQNALSASFILTTSGNVSFALLDDNLVDNLGGLSVSVVPIPEPSTALLLGMGLVVLGHLKSKRRCARNPSTVSV